MDARRCVLCLNAAVDGVISMQWCVCGAWCGVLASIQQTMSVAMSSSLRGHEGSQSGHEAAVRIVDKRGRCLLSVMKTGTASSMHRLVDLLLHLLHIIQRRREPSQELTTLLRCVCRQEEKLTRPQVHPARRRFPAESIVPACNSGNV